MEEKFCLVVAGLGLGYHVAALFDRLHGEAFILCTEPSIPLIATALACVDLTGLISSGRFLLLTDSDKARLHDRLSPHNTRMMLGAQFVQHPPSIRIAGQAHAEIRRVIAEFVTFTRMSLVTLVANSRITCRNIAMNLVTYVTTPPIDLLRGRFAGDPAVVISAGPSLARNIDQLADLKGKAVLCAVQTAVKPLMSCGIVPDFITTLDFHEMSKQFFEGAGDLRGAHLIAEPKATWHVLDDYPGPISVLGNGWAQLLLGDELGQRGGLQAGATVAHLAFYLAVYLGCDPIIFVGQDLSFTGHVFYVPGVEIHQTWRSEINRFQTIEQKEWDRIVRNRPILRRVAGACGGELYTDELLLTYLEQFEKDVAAVPAHVINATEGGARIRGTSAMTLQEAKERFCRRPIDQRRLAYRETTPSSMQGVRSMQGLRSMQWQGTDLSRLSAARAALEKRIDELDSAVAVCEELLVLLDELKGMTHDPTRFNQRLVRIDELRAVVDQESRAYRIVNAATQLAELRRYSADRRIAAVETDDAARARRQITRDIEFITAVRDGAIDVKPMIADALQRIIEKEGASGTHDLAEQPT